MQQMEIESQFIGRAKELAQFAYWLDNASGPWILNIYDALEAPEKKGGVGKTWLLRQYATIARQRIPNLTVVSIDFFNIAERDGVVVAEHVVDALQQQHPSWDPQDFRVVAREYRDALTLKKEELGEIHAKLADAM